MRLLLWRWFWLAILWEGWLCFILVVTCLLGWWLVCLIGFTLFDGFVSCCVICCCVLVWCLLVMRTRFFFVWCMLVVCLFDLLVFALTSVWLLYCWLICLIVGCYAVAFGLHYVEFGCWGFWFCCFLLLWVAVFGRCFCFRVLILIGCCLHRRVDLWLGCCAFWVSMLMYYFNSDLVNLCSFVFCFNYY